MENNSDSGDEQNKNLYETSNISSSHVDNVSLNNATRPTRIFYDGEETFSSLPSSNAAEFHSNIFQKSKGQRSFKKQHSQSSRRSRGNFGNQKRGRGFRNRTSGNSSSCFSRQSSSLSQENEEDNSVSMNSLENFQTTLNEHHIEFLPNSVNVNRLINQRNEEEGESLNPMDKLRLFRRLKEEYSSMMNTLSPDEIIMDYRKEIDKLSYDCTKKNLDKINKVQNLMQEQQAYSHILKFHYENLLLQQKNFDDFINSMKLECFTLSNIHDNNTDNIIKKADRIKMLIENECNIFQRKLPAYAYKSDILNALKDNQVVIVSADSSYFFNTATPIIIMSESNYFVVSCESSNVSCQWIKHDIEDLIKNRIEGFSNFNCMNVENMLSYLKDDKTSRKSCFVLNLSLKRSITCDLLLATLSKVLFQQKDSKLILLLSIFDNAEKYQKYFSSLKIFLLKVPKLLLPIKTIWKKEPLVSKNYKDDVVCTALSIHILNKPGNIMAFLPSLGHATAVLAMLIKKSQELNYNDLEYILLYEDSPNILDLKKPLSKGEKRKIILATHCMESIPIPSVLHVIDCGLMREYVFDSNKNLDVLTTFFNSRARARLRKSLVGVYSSGTCYRIFNKENFCTDMSSYEKPDILTLNPFNTLIKIFHHYPEKALALHFVEPLTDVIKYNTVKQLKNFNAIKDGKLTQLGEKIVKLPFSARYSKLILQGIQWSFAYEAVILVAYFSVDSFLFKFSEDDSHQQVIDASKLNLAQHESDPLTFLEIFKCWMENNCSIAWCDEAQVDFNTLNKVKVKISEICQIVSENLNENINQEFSDLENASDTILELLYQCFSDNLCVFSGHYRCGYRILSSRQTAYLHPSSIICNKENLPQFIIYDKVTKTSRYFLLGITAIPENFVLNSLAEKSLEYEYSDIFERTLSSETIEPVGERIIKQVLLGVEGKKLLEIENSIKEKLNANVVIDPCPEKGHVNVFAPEPVLKEAVNIVNQILKSDLNDVINAETTYTLELQKGEMVIPLEVKCVMGAKITSVIIKNKSQSSVSANDSKKFVSEPLLENISSIKYSINLTWVRRPCNGVCFVCFSPESFAKARKLAMQKIWVLQTETYVEVSSRNENELILNELPPETRANDVEEALKRRLSNINITKIDLKFTRAFETTVKDIEELKMEIQERCEECEDIIDFEIVIPKPKNTATIMTAFINVFGSEDLTAAAEKLSNILIRNFKVNAIPVYRSIIRVNYKVFKALESRIKDGIEKLKFDLSKIFPDRDLFRFEAQYNPDTNLVHFKLLSNDMKIMKHLQKTINELLEGEVLSKNQVKDIHKLFCHGGHMWLRTLEKTKKVHILEEYNSKTIRVYGSRESCFKVKECILNFLEDTENEAVETVILSNDKTKRALMKTLIKEYSVHLEKFVELCGLRSAELNIKTCRLLLHGSRDSIEKAKEILTCISNKLDSTQEDCVLSGGELCPVCYYPAFNLTIRLQNCNHLYCRDCLLGLVEQHKFPIQCCASGCSGDIVLDDIVKILDEDDDKIQKLLRAALNVYLEQNKSEIFYCPAPDCPMFAYKNETSEKWICPLCRNEICTKCNVVYHYGFTCDVYQGSKKDPDYSFKIWKKGTAECKECPNCKTAIEKNAGCDHMTCISCKAHFCWVCVRQFPSAIAVYNHIPFCDQYPKW